MADVLAGAAGAGPGLVAEAVLEVRNLSVRYGGVIALSEVSLSVVPTEVCGVIGPNGAGKTTLFDAVSGLRLLDGGSVRLGGADVTRMSPVRRSRAGLRRTFQRQQVFGRLTVEDNLMVATEWRGGGGGVVADVLALPSRRRREGDRRRAAQQALELCGLTTVRTAYAASLPIGLARMVELARAIVDPPKVLLLDEPTSGLGHTEVVHLTEAIDRVRSDLGCAVLLVEHDVSYVMDHCDKIVVLHLGKVLAEGTPSEMRASPAVRAAYLG